MDQPSWLAEAWREFGQREVAGEADNPRIAALFRDAGRPQVERDEVAWCAAFVGACLARAGVKGTGSLLARSYLDWGEDAGAGRPGAVVVLSRGADPALGHVGFLLGATADELFVLGGNQDDAVTVASFPRARLLGLRWPAPAGQADTGDGGFERALAHVLRMEGGYTNDPYDPGGPTNKGITLAVLAAWRGVALDAASRAGLIAELKQIPDSTVRAIYRTRYWRPAHCPELPAPLALMHFDAAVNHGVGAAIRMLQETVGAAIDGEIGPETRGAIARTDPAVALAAYAAIRRRRYRALPHFWRFGRGWLARVDKTLARAGELIAAAPGHSPSQQQQQKGDETMQTDAKWWGQSMTIWGALITALSTVVPALGPVIGVDITGDLVRQAGEQIVQTTQAVAGLVGTLLTVYGRFRATQPLERRDVNVKL